MYRSLLKHPNRLMTLKRVISLEASKLQASHENGSTSTYRENFATRHVGVGKKDEAEMLKILNVKVFKSIQAFLSPTQY